MEKGKTLFKVPESINADLMSVERIHEELKAGFDDIEKGNVQDAIAAFEHFEENCRYEKMI